MYSLESKGPAMTARALIEKWYSSTLAGNDETYVGHTEEEWESLEQAIATALQAREQAVFKEVEARCNEKANENQKAHDRALKAGREGVAMCRQSDCETLDEMGLWCRARAKGDGCQHEWGIDGMHSNEFCKKCFVSKEN